MGIVCSDYREDSPRPYDPRIVMCKNESNRDRSSPACIFGEHRNTLNTREKVSLSKEQEVSFKSNHKWEVHTDQGLLQTPPKRNNIPIDVLVEENKHCELEVRKSKCDLKEEQSNSPAKHNEPGVQAVEVPKMDTYHGKRWLQPTPEGNNMPVDVLREENIKFQSETRQFYGNLKEEDSSSPRSDSKFQPESVEPTLEVPRKWKDIRDWQGWLQTKSEGIGITMNALSEEKKQLRLEARQSYPEPDNTPHVGPGESFAEVTEKWDWQGRIKTTCEESRISIDVRHEWKKQPQLEARQSYVELNLEDMSSPATDDKLLVGPEEQSAETPKRWKGIKDWQDWLQTTPKGNKKPIDELREEKKHLQLVARHSWRDSKEKCSRSPLPVNRLQVGPEELTVKSPEKLKDMWNGQSWFKTTTEVNTLPRGVLVDTKSQQKEPKQPSYDLWDDNRYSPTRANLIRVRSEPTAPRVEVPNEDSVILSGSSFYSSDDDDELLDPEYQFPATGSDGISGQSGRIPSPKSLSTPPWVVNSQYSSANFNRIVKPANKVPTMFNTRIVKRDGKNNDVHNLEQLMPYTQMESTPESDISHLEGITPNIGVYSNSSNESCEVFHFASFSSKKSQQGSCVSSSGILIADVPVRLKTSPLASGTEGFIFNHRILEAN